MVSSELLRRYPLFGKLTDDHLRTIAMISEEVTLEQAHELFHEGEPADALFLLIEGGLDLHFVVVDPINRKLRKDLFVTEVTPGEPFGISALIEPHVYVSTVRATAPSRVMRIDAARLRALCEEQPSLGSVLIRQVAKVAMARLHDTRVQLVAARS
jgi:CRP-like cAMP-binding protein